MIDDLKENAAGRRQAIVDKINGAIRQIEKDLKDHDGIYPHNKGKLNQAEVCRRAGVRPALLQGPAHKDTTLHDLNMWLKSVQERIKTKRNDVRAEVTKRADAWKEAYENVLFQYNLDRLELLDAQTLLAEKEERIKELESEISLLREQVSGGKVTPMRRPSQPSQGKA